MVGAEKWHRGYVQGTARDGGELQGMTGVEGEFSLGQGILKSIVLLDYARSLAVYTSCHVCLLSISLYPFICQSAYPSLFILFFIFFTRSYLLKGEQQPECIFLRLPIDYSTYIFRVFNFHVRDALFKNLQTLQELFTTFDIDFI